MIVEIIFFLAKTCLYFRLLCFLKMSTPIDTADIASMCYSVGNPQALGMSQSYKNFHFFSSLQFMVYNFLFS